VKKLQFTKDELTLIDRYAQEREFPTCREQWRG
jgi:hypothetical protein